MEKKKKSIIESSLEDAKLNSGRIQAQLQLTESLHGILEKLEGEMGKEDFSFTLVQSINGADKLVPHPVWQMYITTSGVYLKALAATGLNYNSKNIKEKDDDYSLLNDLLKENEQQN